jgi:hypothetical protein
METIRDTIPPGFITKPEAMALVNRSLKVFERLVKEHRIETVAVRMTGRRPMPTYRETDLRSLLRPVPVAPRPRTDVSAVVSTLSTTLKQIAAPAAATRPPVTLGPKHLLTMAEAHQLGWPLELLREMKRRDNPPGVRYGRRSFKFSADALRMELEAG